MQSLENKGKNQMTSQDDAASCVNVTGTDRKIDALQTQPDSLDVHGWRPISTAPKDKTPILAYGSWAGEINGIDETKAMYVARWSGRSDYSDHLWVIEGTDAYAAWCKPTHWMPLPAPPVLP